MIETFKTLREINPWDRNIKEPGLKRSVYLNKIMSFTGNKLIKVITGQRRTGKSYLMRQIMNELISSGVSGRNIFYLNKEYIEFDNIRTYKDLDALFKYYIETISPSKKIYIFLDEVQEIEGWERFANSYSQSMKKNYEIFLTGSNSRMLSGELSTLLSGRYINFEIQPFLYPEFCRIRKKTPGKESLLEYINTGGLPELYNLSSEESRRQYIDSVLSTIILKDIVQRYKIKDPVFLENIFRFISGNIGNMVSINNIVNHFKSQKITVNYESVSSYIKYLSEAYLIYEVQRYDIRGKNTLIGNRKYFINDLSYKHLNFSSFEKNMSGILENLIFHSLKSAGYKIFVGSIYEKEIDFIAEKNNIPVYVQVAYLIPDDKTANREFGNLASINDNYQKFVVSMDDAIIKDINGIKHYSIWDFLYNLDKILKI